MARFDVIVIGCGPAGERAAIYAARAGKEVAVVEQAAAVGGARINWGTIPSKTLRESALLFYGLTRHRVHGIRFQLEGPLTVPDLMYHERAVVQRELDLVNRALDRYRIQVFRGHASFVDPHSVAVIGSGGEKRLVLKGEVIVIATGGSPNRPTDVPFDDESIFDSDTILGLKRIPGSMIVLGAGVIGVEYASIFAALGVEVTLVDTRDRLLPYLDREIAEILEREMRRLGVAFLHDDHYAFIDRVAGPAAARIACRTRQGNRLEADVLLYCVGRDGNTRDLGLDAIGIEPNERGLLDVNANLQTRHAHVYAVGDVIGYPALASTSMEQGRQAMRHAFRMPGAMGMADMLPFAIYAIPEVSHIGETEEGLREKGIDYVVGRGRYELNPRGQIAGDTGGLLKLLFEADGMRLAGAHVVGTNASELVHLGEVFLKLGASAKQIAETLFNYPTLSDLYRHAALEAMAVLASRGQGTVGGLRDEPAPAGGGG